MDYLAVQQTAGECGVISRWVQARIKRCNIDGVARFGLKPIDGRKTWQEKTHKAEGAAL